jgi:hypothetical protein
MAARTMRTMTSSTLAREDAGRGFETIADTIMYRSSAERDLRVSDEEVEQAREYLARRGVTTSALQGGGRAAVHVALAYVALVVVRLTLLQAVGR